MKKSSNSPAVNWSDAHLVFRSWSLIFFSISASVRVSSRGHHWSASPVFLMAISTVGRGFSLQNTKHRHTPSARLSGLLPFVRFKQATVAVGTFWQQKVFTKRWTLLWDLWAHSSSSSWAAKQTDSKHLFHSDVQLWQRSALVWKRFTSREAKGQTCQNLRVDNGHQFPTRWSEIADASSRQLTKTPVSTLKRLSEFPQTFCANLWLLSYFCCFNLKILIRSQICCSTATTQINHFR